MRQAQREIARHSHLFRGKAGAQWTGAKWQDDQSV
jgi:hypothetical protein